MTDKLTHLDAAGRAQMVDVGPKPDTERSAVAEAFVTMSAATFAAVRDGTLKKGDVVAVARLAGIMAAKRTAELIPLCHPLPLTHIDVTVELDAAASRVRVQASVRSVGKTGVEMEALVATSTAALTIYDMAKALDRAMRVDGLRVLDKRGGQRGDYTAASNDIQQP